MKKFFMALAALIIVAVLVFVKDPEAQKSEVASSVYTTILQHNAQMAYQSCEQLQHTLSEAVPGRRTDQIDQDFKSLILAWKRVQASYILGDYEDDMKDIPLFVDNFHMGKGDVNAPLKRAIQSRSEPSISLYRSSSQTVNALEYMLYVPEEMTDRTLVLSRYMTQSICIHLQEIDQAYQNLAIKITADPKLMLTNLMNALSNQTFMLKDWRVGDVAGHTIKYRDLGGAYSRSEYPFSQNSLAAVQAILQTQEALMGQSQEVENLADLIGLFGVSKQLQDAQDLLKQAKEASLGLLNEQDLANYEQTNKLYNSINLLQKSYYQSLIPALALTQKILEADGD